MLPFTAEHAISTAFIARRSRAESVVPRVVRTADRRQWLLARRSIAFGAPYDPMPELGASASRRHARSRRRRDLSRMLESRTRRLRHLRSRPSHGVRLSRVPRAGVAARTLGNP